MKKTKNLICTDTFPNELIELFSEPIQIKYHIDDLPQGTRESLESDIEDIKDGRVRTISMDELRKEMNSWKYNIHFKLLEPFNED